MIITVRNAQRVIPVKSLNIKKQLKYLLGLCKVEDYDVGLKMLSDRKMKEINKFYRNADKTTDIISIPVNEDIVAGKIPPSPHRIKDLGDIYIGINHVAKKCATTDASLDQQMSLLITHGLCHLLGYDHYTTEDFRKMRARESYLLKKLEAFKKELQSEEKKKLKKTQVLSGEENKQIKESQ